MRIQDQKRWSRSCKTYTYRRSRKITREGLSLYTISICIDYDVGAGRESESGVVDAKDAPCSLL